MVRSWTHRTSFLFFLSSILLPVKAPWSSGIIDATRPATLSVYKVPRPSTVEFPKEIIKGPGSSRICRRWLGLRACNGGRIKPRLMDGKRPRKDLRHEPSSYTVGTEEEAIATAIRLQPDWEEAWYLSERIIELSIFRRRLRFEIGGFSYEIAEYIRKKIPITSNVIADSLGSILKALPKKPATQSEKVETEQRIAILRRFLETEAKDSETYEYIMTERNQALLKKLERLYPAKSGSIQATSTELDTIVQASLEPQPLVPDPEIIREWSNYQATAELEHASYVLANRHTSVLAQEYKAISFLHIRFLQRATATGWLDQRNIKINDYKYIQYIEKERDLLLRSAIENAREYYQHGTPESVEAIAKARLAMQTLVIQSINGPNSKLALRILQDLADQESITRGTSTSRKHLDVALKFQDKSVPPPSNLDDIQSLRNFESVVPPEWLGVPARPKIINFYGPLRSDSPELASSQVSDKSGRVLEKSIHNTRTSLQLEAQKHHEESTRDRLLTRIHFDGE